MKGRQLRRRFSLQPSFMKDDSPEDKHKRDKSNRSDADDGGASAAGDARHKIVVMGAARVGKTSIITQFLYGSFSTKYKRTVEEMHKGDFSIHGVNLTLDILDTSGSFEFPAMRTLSIGSADAFILVYDVCDAATFEEVRQIRDQIHECKRTAAVPIVVVGNKSDVVMDGNSETGTGAELEMDRVATQQLVTAEWENGFVQCSAKENENVTQIFKELLVQAKITYNLSPALRRRRRQSLPMHQAGSSGGGGSGAATPSHHAAPSAMSSHVPSAAQLQHLQQIQERSIGGKRQSCIIS